MPEIRDPRIDGRWARVDGVRVHYQHRSGAGPTLVLLPGGMLDSSTFTWKLLLETLPARYRIVSPDLPGYGNSDRPDAPYTTAYYVRFLEGFLREVQAPRPVLFASSMSGVVALAHALRWPERVGALVLSGAYGVQPRTALHEGAYLLSRVPGITWLMRRLLRMHPLVVRLALPFALRGPAHVTDALVQDAYAEVLHPQALRAFGRWMRHELRPRRVRTCLAEELPALDVPALFLHGRHDRMLPPRYTLRAARAMPRAEAYLFPDCGHLVPRERPAEVRRLVLRFLRRCERQGAFAEQETAGRNPAARHR